MSTDNTKRNVNGYVSAPEDLSGGSGSPVAKRAKTDAMATDPTSEVVLNPDILSKALLYIDMSEVPSVAQTCKVWKHTLGSVEQVLWKGIAARHHPTLVQITDMLPDNVEEGNETPKTMKAKSDGTIIALPPPSKNWKNQMKRNKLLNNRDYQIKKGPVKRIDSYVFEIHYKILKVPILRATVLRSASFSGNCLKIDPISIQSSVPFRGGDVVAKITIIDKKSGRHSALSPVKPIVSKRPNNPGSPTVMCISWHRVQTGRLGHDGPQSIVIAIDFKIVMNSGEAAPGRQSAMRAFMDQEQILTFLHQDLDWV